jgi:arginyl-tRNA synthetase
MKARIVKSLQEATGIKEVHLEFPENEAHGDYATNVALVSAKKKKKEPKELAEKIIKKLQKDKDLAKIVSKIEVAGPGFINFFLSKEALLGELKQVPKEKNSYGKSNTFKSKRIVVEFAHPNTHKSFHIGHLRNITTGEAIVRILEAVGAKVIRVNYQGDIGLHIAKAIWGIKKTGFKDPKDVKKRMDYLGRAYVTGNSAYEKNDKSKGEIGRINRDLYKGEDKKLVKLYQTTRKWSLDYFDKIYKRVYTKFDRLYFESEVANPGKTIALEALKKGILIRSRGAVIYPGKKMGLHNRVFVTSEGLATYEAKDLGLARLQFAEFKPDLILHVVGPEQKEYFEVLFKALEEISPTTKGKEVHLIYGWVRLKEGKMASREGKVVLGDWLIGEIKREIIKTYKTPEKVAEKVAIAAVKYSFLKPSLSQEIAFDIEKSISLDGNSGPYLQYTYARTQSVLRKAKAQDAKYDKQDINDEEALLLRSFPRFSETIIDAAKNYSPNLLANYLFDLAQKYNNFYNQHRIIGSENQGLRIMLTIAVGQILKNGLTLLGIKTPERM